MPPYHEIIQEKIDGNVSKGKEIEKLWYDVDLDNFKRMYEEAETIDYPHMTNKLVIGDSHSICMYRPGWTVNSVPFKTLNGFCKEGIEKYIPADQEFDEIELYFGNIDIRHHIVRLGANIKELCDRYIEQAQKVNAKIYELLPIENEKRKIPKTGYYKGKPFHGSWEERNQARIEFNNYIEEQYGIIRWAKYLLNRKGELDFAYMEKPQSIHLSREFYPHWNEIKVNQVTLGI
jgi:hypothetical protein